MTGYYSHLPASFRKSSGTVQKRAQPERALQIRVATMLRWMLPPDVPWTAIAHGTFSFSQDKARAIQIGARMKATGLHPGWPDLLLIVKGRPAFLELKSGKGSLSPAQKAVHEAITVAGGVVSVCRTEDEVVAFLKVLGIPLQARLSPAERAVLKARALAG